eukprot:gene5751-5991_t
MGHAVVLAGLKGRATPYPQVFNHPSITFASRISPVILNKSTHSTYMHQADIHSLFNFYRNDDQMKRTDAIMCAFPVSYCEAWMPFNKTLIWWPVHRYSLGRCSTARWERLTQHLQAAAEAGHIIAAGSLYDAEYIRYFTGLQAELLPSSSLWYAHNTTLFTKSRSEILVGPAHSSRDLPSVFRDSKRHTFAHIKELYPRYELQNLADHRAVVILPYSVNAYGMVELYALGIPMFVPSVELLTHPLEEFAGLALMNDVKVTDSFYCGSSVGVPPPHAHQPHPFSPESDAPEAKHYWYKFAEFYHRPHITTFDSFQDLLNKLDVADFDAIHQRMMVENARLKHQLAVDWNKVLAKVRKGSTIPASYQQALSMLWNSSQLQVD